MKKIYDSWDLSYKSVFGAIKSEEFCDFTIKLPDSLKIDSAPVMTIYKIGFKAPIIKSFLFYCIFFFFPLIPLGHHKAIRRATCS